VARRLATHGTYDQRINGGDVAAGADQRVEVEFADEVALVGDEFGGAADNLAQQRQIDTRQSTIALQQAKRAQFMQQRVRFIGPDRRRRQRGVVYHLDENAAEADDHQGAE